MNFWSLTKDYLIMVPVKDIYKIHEQKMHFEELEYEEMFQLQEKINESTVSHPIALKYPPSLNYQKLFLKNLINKIENANQEVNESLYNLMSKLISQDSSEQNECYLTYTILDEIPITLNATRKLVTEGTTGLFVWEASYVLAEFCLKNPEIFNGKNVFELGCGLGLTGISVIKKCLPSSYILTDHHISVMEFLWKNLHINLDVKFLNNDQVLDCNGVKVQTQLLDWTLNEEEFSTDVVLASDVIYDESIIEPFLRTLYKTLSQSESIAYIASTIRNQKTFDTYCNKIGQFNLKVISETEVNYCPYSTLSPVKVIIHQIQRNI